MKIARVYLRVSTIEQSNQRQEKIIDEAMDNGYYIAKVYREQASGTIKDRPKLPQMLDRYPELAAKHVARWLGGKSDYLKA